LKSNKFVRQCVELVNEKKRKHKGLNSNASLPFQSRIKVVVAG